MIEGTKWLDQNGNGQRDEFERGLAGVTVYLDLNGNDRLDDNEPSTVTASDNPATFLDESGRYRFSGLPAGTYLVREVVPDGFQQSFPRNFIDIAIPPADPLFDVEPRFITAELGAGETLETEVSLTIHPFCVRPFDVEVIASSPHADFQNHSGVIVNGCGGDKSTFNVTITGVGVSQVYDLQFVDALSESPLATIPVAISATGSAAHLVVLESGEQVSGLDFGNQRIPTGSVSGIKWRDDNGNGLLDDNEPGLPGVTIYADLNRNDQLDPNEPSTRTLRDDPETDFDEGGRYTLDGLPAGEHLVREVVPDGFRQTFPRDIVGPPIPVPDGSLDQFVTVSPHSIAVPLTPGQVYEDTISIQVHPLCFEALTIDVVASNPDIEFHNQSGVQINGCGGDKTEFEISFVANETPQRFEIQFIDVGFGAGNVLASIPVAIMGGESGGHLVRLRPGQTVEDINFGNQRVNSASVHGRKWRDDNGDGDRDQDEPGLGGIVVYADVNRNNRLDRGEPSTRTLRDNPNTDFDEAGLYSLEGLPEGSYFIREVEAKPFEQTFPGPLRCRAIDCVGDGHLVSVQSGDMIEGLDFGNAPRLPGDADLDADVDSADRTILTRFWTGAIPPGRPQQQLIDRTWSEGDFDNDGDVDTADLTLLVKNWTGAIFTPVDLAASFAARSNRSSLETNDEASSQTDLIFATWAAQPAVKPRTARFFI